MDSRVGTIARYTLLEALRTRLSALVLIALAALLATSFFVEALAITESARFQSGFYAAGARLAAVFIVLLHVLVSVTRELDDKGLDVVLALDLPRSHYVLGKLAGFLAAAALVAAAAALPLAMASGPVAALQWMISLACELAIVAALALFCVLAFGQLAPAASFVLAFYLLARSLAAMRLMSAHPIAGGDSLAHQAAHYLVEAIALVMPALDAWTQTAWLVNEPAAWSALLLIAGQSVIYVALIAAAAMFDFYRKNF